MSLKRKSYIICPICGSYCTEETDYMEHILCEQYTNVFMSLWYRLCVWE